LIEFFFDSACGFFHLLDRNRSLSAGKAHGVEDFLSVEVAPASVSFDYEQPRTLKALPSGKSLGTFGTFTSSSDGFTVSARTRVQDFQIIVSAKRTVHSFV
jgi:hypothetical protein